MRVVRAISPRRPAMWLCRRSSGSEKLRRRSRLPVDSIEACMLTPATGGPGPRLDDWDETVVRHDVWDAPACRMPFSFAQFACTASACRSRGRRWPDQGGDRPALVRKGDSNPHALRHWNLNPGRLPIPPLSRGRTGVHCRRRRLESEGLHKAESTTLRAIAAIAASPAVRDPPGWPQPTAAVPCGPGAAPEPGSTAASTFRTSTPPSSCDAGHRRRRSPAHIHRTVRIALYVHRAGQDLPLRGPGRPQLHGVVDLARRNALCARIALDSLRRIIARRAGRPCHQREGNPHRAVQSSDLSHQHLPSCMRHQRGRSIGCDAGRHAVRSSAQH